jgi:hypothetical protein
MRGTEVKAAGLPSEKTQHQDTGLSAARQAMKMCLWEAISKLVASSYMRR